MIEIKGQNHKQKILHKTNYSCVPKLCSDKYFRLFLAAWPLFKAKT
jgi:hypothetical protein